MGLEEKIGVGHEADLALHREIEWQLLRAKESEEVRSLYLKDIGGTFGISLDKLLDARGYRKKAPDKYYYLNLPEYIIAATIIIDDGTTILAYNQKYAEMFRKKTLMRTYVNLHEHAHIRGELSESHTEGLVGDAARAAKEIPAYLLNKAGEVYKNIYQKARQIEEYSRYRQLAYGSADSK